MFLSPLSVIIKFLSIPIPSHAARQAALFGVIQQKKTARDFYKGVWLTTVYVPSLIE